MDKYNVAAVILAAGSGQRMNIGTTKQQLQIAGKTVLRRALEAFEACPDVTSITVVIRDGEQNFAKEQISGLTKINCIITGGKTRAESAKIGFGSIPSDSDLVAIHDAARCLIRPSDISAVVNDAKMHGAASAAMRVTDTVKLVDTQGFVTDTPDRDHVMLATTPQIFKTEMYARALRAVGSVDSGITDDNMLLERAGYRVYCTDTGRENIKITHSDDVEYAEFILRSREK